MFCNNCGKPLDGKTKFCTNCGAENTHAGTEPAETPAADVPVKEEPAVMPPTEVQAEKEEKTAGPVQAASMIIGEEEPPKPKKKKGKKKLLIAAIIAVVLVAAITISAFASPFVGNLLAKTFLPADKYLGYAIKNTAKALATEISDSRGIIKEATGTATGSRRVEGDVVLTAGEDLKTLLGEATGMDMAWAGSVGIGMETATDGGDLFGLKGNVQLNGTEIAKVDVAMDFEDGMAYVSLPGINDKAIGTALPYSYTYMMEEQSEIIELINRLLDVVPEEKVLKEMLSRYAEQVVLQIQDVEKESVKLTVGETTQSVTELRAKISEKTLMDIAEAVCKEARDDKEIKKIIQNAAEIEEFGLDADGVYEDFQDAMDAFLEEIEEEDPDRETLCELKVWVNSSGIIIGAGAEVEDAEFSFYMLQKGKNAAMALKINADGTKFVFEGGGTTGGGKQNAVYTASVDNKEVLKVKISDFDDAKLQEGILNGTISFTLGKALTDEIEDRELSDMLQDARLDIVFRQETKNDAEIEIVAYTDDTLFASLKIGTKQGENGKVDMPATYVNADDDGQMEAWVAEADFTAVLDNLRTAGLPGELVDLLQATLNPGTAETAENALVDPQI